MTLSSGTQTTTRKRITQAELEIIQDELVDIAREYAPCTVRQVYYLATTKDLCDKTQKGYNFIQRQLLKLRRNRRIPYTWIADSARSVLDASRYNSVKEFKDSIINRYYLNYWNEQDYNVQFWCESAAIAQSIKQTVIFECHTALRVAKGFSSETYLYEAGKEIEKSDKPTKILIVSDFDPSGIGLAADIEDKLYQFCGGVEIDVERIALSLEQVQDLDLTTHPLKTGDTRAKGFIEQFGVNFAAELEAIPPNLLRQYVRDSILKNVDDMEAFKAVTQKQRLQRNQITEALEEIDNQ